MKNILKILNVVSFLILLALGLAFLPSFASVLMLLGSALLFPFKQWQKFVREKFKIKSAIKITLVVVLFIASCMIAPESESTGDIQDAPASNPTPTQETILDPEPSHTTATTPELTPEPTPVPNLQPAPELTATPTPEPTPESTPIPTPEPTPSPDPIYFKVDNVVNRFFINYNAIAEITIPAEKIENGNIKTKALVYIDDLSLEIINAGDYISVSMSAAAENEATKLYNVFKDTIQSMRADISKQDINNVWNEIHKSGYLVSDYDFKGINITYVPHKELSWGSSDLRIDLEFSLP